MMQCPRCQFDNRETAKFCEECGTPLSQVCSRCGHEVRARARFCPECGRQLGDASPNPRFTSPHSYTPKHLADKILTFRSALHGERKHVTVLFADVAGFSTLAEALEPEDVHLLMDGCFDILTQQVHAYEGTINQFTGDGIMALFGAPIAHEDHAGRGLHAALGIQAALREYGATVQQRPPGTWQVLGPMPVRGKAAPVAVYELRGRGVKTTRNSAAGLVCCGTKTSAKGPTTYWLHYTICSQRD